MENQYIASAASADKELYSPYRALLNNIDSGFCILEVLFDENNEPWDCLYHETNHAFERETGLHNVIGKTIGEALKQTNPLSLKKYAEVVEKQARVHFEFFSEPLGRYYDVIAHPFDDPSKKLIAVFFLDITHKKQLQEELSAKELHYKNTLDSMMEGCAILSFEWKYLYVNDINAEHARSTKEDMIGKSMFDIIPGVEKSDFYQCYKKCMDERVFQTYEGHFKFADGTEEWYESKVHPVPEGIFVLSLNTTARKDAEIKLQETMKLLREKIQEKEVLLKELYHRTKNNMQIISSLLNLRGAKIQNEVDKYIFLETRNRIQAMSLVHERLYRTKSLSTLNLSVYIKELVDLLVTSHSDRSVDFAINYQLQDADVSITVAIPVGLVVTELLLNIIKYAFKDKTTGNVNIKLAKEDDAYLLFEISDDGIGINKEELNREKNLGIQIVKTLIEDQLRGKIELDNTHGTCWTMIFNSTL